MCWPRMVSNRQPSRRAPRRDSKYPSAHLLFRHALAPVTCTPLCPSPLLAPCSATECPLRDPSWRSVKLHPPQTESEHFDESIVLANHDILRLDFTHHHVYAVYFCLNPTCLHSS